MSSKRRAVVLLSGGLDSATVLAIAHRQDFECYALSFDYGQRHRAELQASKHVADQLGIAAHRTVQFDLTDIGGSALTDNSIPVPELEDDDQVQDQIPVTYVPARNTLFLATALGWAEVLGAQDIFIGVNAVDYSGYPDCRPEYIEAFEKMANLATKAGVEGHALTIQAPLIDWTKAQIIERGTELGVDYGLTVSCYQADEQGRACGVCESCHLRKKGFTDAGVVDPTRYR